MRRELGCAQVKPRPENLWGEKRNQGGEGRFPWPVTITSFGRGDCLGLSDVRWRESSPKDWPFPRRVWVRKPGTLHPEWALWQLSSEFQWPWDLAVCWTDTWWDCAKEFGKERGEEQMSSARETSFYALPKLPASQLKNQWKLWWNSIMFLPPKLSGHLPQYCIKSAHWQTKSSKLWLILHTKNHPVL